MRYREKEMDIDFIGGLGPLTKEDEKAISDFLQSRKTKKTKTRLFSRKNTRKVAKTKN